LRLARATPARSARPVGRVVGAHLQSKRTLSDHLRNILQSGGFGVGLELKCA